MYGEGELVENAAEGPGHGEPPQRNRGEDELGTKQAKPLPGSDAF